MVNYLSYIFILILFCTTTLRAESNIERRTRFNVEVKGLSNIQDLAPEEINNTITKNPLNLSTFIAGVGRINIVLNQERDYGEVPVYINHQTQIKNKNTIRLLRGTLYQKSSTQPIAASIYSTSKQKYQLNINFYANNNRGGKNNYYNLRIKFAKNSSHSPKQHKLQAKVSKLSYHSAFLKSCNPYKGLSFRHQNSKRITALNETNSTNLNIEAKTGKLLTLGIHADNDFYMTFADNSTTKIMDYINQAEVIYEDQLGLTFSIKFIKFTADSSLNSKDSQTLLENFKAYVSHVQYSSQAALNHLFSGKTLYANVLGITYLDVICSSPADSVSLSCAPNDLIAPMVFAHELGHTFGAEHTESGIMMAALSVQTPPTTFSEESVNVISQHIKEKGSCLSPTLIPTRSPTPQPIITPTPTITPSPTQYPDLKINTTVKLNKTGEFKLNLELNDQYPYCSLAVFCNNKEDKLTTSPYKFSFLTKNNKLSLQTRLPFTLTSNLKKTKIYFQALITCQNNQTALSNMVRIIPSKVQAKNKIKTTKKWLKKFMNLNFKVS